MNEKTDEKRGESAPFSIKTSEISSEQAFIPLAIPEQSSSSNLENKDFYARSKEFEPAVGSLIKILDGTCYKVLRRKARNVIEDEEKADEIASVVRLSRESIDAAKGAGARIAARRCTNTEIMDYTVLLGVAAELATGFADVLSQLKRMEKQLGRNHD